jgi:L-rhamnose isomerase
MFGTVPEKAVNESYALAKVAYARFGVDSDAAIGAALKLPVSLHCWQADDVAGLETKAGAAASGGIMATGNYPGRARNGAEIRADLEKVLSVIPGLCRVNVHAFYAETGNAVVDRDRLEPAHFEKWVAWAKAKKIGLDFNPTFFAHPKAADGFTLSHRDAAIRKFWVDHAIACRRIAEHMGRSLGTPCIINHWIPDGAKDSPADRWSPRARLVESLDAMLAPSTGVDRSLCVDAVESKLFGLGSEDYVVGSHEFYLNYALSRGVVPCMDMGHFHPTEGVHDKLSSVLQFNKKVLLHVSRPIRWDSDHVVLFNDDVRSVFLELARGGAMDRAYVALDYFDASINRIVAYGVGARSTRKAALYALLEPSKALKDLEAEGKNAEKLALMEEMKTMPFGAAWDMLCLKAGAPVGAGWIAAAQAYERDVLSKRR